MYADPSGNFIVSALIGTIVGIVTSIVLDVATSIVTLASTTLATSLITIDMVTSLSWSTIGTTVAIASNIGMMIPNWALDISSIVISATILYLSFDLIKKGLYNLVNLKPGTGSACQNKCIQTIDSGTVMDATQYLYRGFGGMGLDKVMEFDEDNYNLWDEPF